jgi:hypothetical protein
MNRQPSPAQRFQEQVKASLRELLEETECFNSCLSCVTFNEERELCGQSNPPARPPARVIAFGCPAYIEDESSYSTLPPVQQPTPIPPKTLSDFSDLDDDDIPF